MLCNIRLNDSSVTSCVDYKSSLRYQPLEYAYPVQSEMYFISGVTITSIVPIEHAVSICKTREI